jgi:hypothetical protein
MPDRRAPQQVSPRSRQPLRTAELRALLKSKPITQSETKPPSLHCLPADSALAGICILDGHAEHGPDPR